MRSFQGIVSYKPKHTVKFSNLHYCRLHGKFLSPYLYSYRKNVNAQQELLALIENWKKVLDNKGFAVAVLMDLSKAFDTINHDLLVAKLHAYGFSNDSLKLLYSYLV